MKKILLKSFIILLILTPLITNTVSAQADCGNTFGLMTNPTSQTSLCDDGSDAINFVYDINDNLSSPSLPNFAYVFESPAGLTFLESGSVSIDPTDSLFMAMAGESICVTGFAVNLNDVNSIISTLASPFWCGLAGLDPAVCAIIADLDAQGGISSISEAVDFGVNLGLTPPTTTTEAIALLVSADSTAALLGGICFSVSNSGSGYDYCYNVESCCPAVLIHQEPFVATETLYEVSNYIESSAIIETTENITYSATNYIELLSGFETEVNSDFTAIINGCY